MKNQFLNVFALVAAVFLVSQPAAAGECDVRDALFTAADEARVPLNREQTVTATAPGVTFAGTSIAGYEQVPPTALPNGVDAGFIYLDAIESGIPAGFYRLNVRADKPRVGTYEGLVDLYSTGGKLVAQLPASMETWSMEVPRPLPFEQTLMEVQVHNEPESQVGMIRWPIRITIIIRWPSGTTTTTTIGRG